jgi:unsaturated rhamnogalacturonyl hydrolase
LRRCASLLAPERYPIKETSGSGFYTYALAWGVNQGLLDRAQYEPAVRQAWAALAGSEVYRLTSIGTQRPN